MVFVSARNDLNGGSQEVCLIIICRALPVLSLKNVTKSLLKSCKSKKSLPRCKKRAERRKSGAHIIKWLLNKLGPARRDIIWLEVKMCGSSAISKMFPRSAQHYSDNILPL